MVRDRTVTFREPGGSCSMSCHGHHVMGRATIKRWWCQSCLMRLLSQKGLKIRAVERTGSLGQWRAVPELSAATPGSPQAGPPFAQVRALGALQPAAPSASAQAAPCSAPVWWAPRTPTTGCSAPGCVGSVTPEWCQARKLPVKLSCCQCLILGSYRSGSGCLMGCSSVLGAPHLWQ